MSQHFWCEAAWLGGEHAAQRVLIAVDHGVISSIQINAECPEGATRLMGLTLPGLANAHSHAFHRALRSRTHGGAGTFWTWRDQMYTLAERLDPERYHRLATAVFAEMALAGVTCVGEFHYVHHDHHGRRYSNPNAMSEALIDAAAQAGVRITMLDTCYLAGGPGQPLNMLQQRFSDGSFDAWAERAAATATPAHARLGAAAHSVRAVPPAELHAMGAWCREHSTVLHAHVSEQPAENEQCLAAYGLTPVGLLAREGVLDGDFTAVHATHLTDADIALLGAFEAHIALCPTTERDLADGVGPAAALKAANAQLCVGSDSHAVIDLFEEVRAIELDERLVTLQRGRHRPLSLLEAATVNGHRSLGWSDAGRLMEGYRADFVTVRTDSVRTAGAALGSMVEMAVYAASAADVAHVVCDGNVVVSEGRHRSIDVGRELAHSISELLDVRDDQTGGSAS